ncbi:MFS transporter [Nostoc flagelliforme FACHB-838]|uniref:MFS transporter n=2 Tax=Nostoc flagelliforme TaxID=1306274 RepID=A0ABR8DRQ6_9NOSO|nr:MFS transporter [Nostoc flagelliforme FACHB-838]
MHLNHVIYQLSSVFMTELISTKSNSPFSTGLPALYSIAFLSGISIGLFNPFISTLMAQHQVDDLWIGANSTVYFLVIALGTPFVVKVLPKLGLRKTMMLGLTMMGISAPLFTMTTSMPLWFIIRAVMGIACCLYLVSGNTALNHFCHEGNRAIVNGLNALAFTFGFGIGPVIGSAFYNVSPKLSFLLGSALIFSGVIVVWIALPDKTVVFQQSSRSGIFNKLKLPLQGAFAYGFAESTLVSLYPVYLLRQNYNIEQIGYTFAVFVVGGLLSTVPVTHIADKFGRLKVLFMSVSIVILSFLSLSLIQDSTATQIFAFIAGASISPIFPLAMALIGAKLSRNELSSGSALFTAIYSFGCTAGPIASSLAIKLFGDGYIFSLVIIIFAIFLFYVGRQNKKFPFRSA